MGGDAVLFCNTMYRLFVYPARHWGGWRGVVWLILLAGYSRSIFHCSKVYCCCCPTGGIIIAQEVTTPPTFTAAVSRVSWLRRARRAGVCTRSVVAFIFGAHSSSDIAGSIITIEGSFTTHS